MNGGYRLGLVLVTISAIAWSTAGLFTRLISTDAWTMLAWRGVFGAIAMLFVMLAVERGRAMSGFRTMGWPGAAFVLVSALGMVMFLTSLRNTTVAHNAVIYATVPFMAAGLGFLVMGERPARSAVLASLTALVGVAIMVGLGVEGGMLGDVLALGMTACMAVMMVIARRWRDIPVMPTACLSAVVTAIVSWPLGDPINISGHDLLLLAGFGVVNSAMGLALFTYGARYLPAIETALIGALDAPLAPLWVWFLLSETPSPPTLFGGLIVFGAVVAHVLAGARHRAGTKPAPA